MCSRVLVAFYGTLVCTLGACGPLNNPHDGYPANTSGLATTGTFAESRNRWVSYESSHGHEVDTPFGRLHYLKWGNSERTLLWLHGTYSSAYEFATLAEHFVKEGYQVLSVDWYGHGRTPLPSDAVSPYDFVDGLIFLMDQLNIQQAAIGGWSRGAMIAAFVYDAFPDRVTGLILVDGGSWSPIKVFDSLDDEELLMVLGHSRTKSDSGELPVATFDTLENLLNHYEFSGKTWMARVTLLARAKRNAAGRWMMLSPVVLNWLHQHTIKAAMRGCRKPSETSLFFWSCTCMIPENIFRRLDVPMLIIDPIDDPLKTSEQNQALKEKHPQLITYKQYRHTGHNVIGQRPQQFVSDACRFLRDLTPHPSPSPPTNPHHRAHDTSQ